MHIFIKQTCSIRLACFSFVLIFSILYIILNLFYILNIRLPILNACFTSPSISADRITLHNGLTNPKIATFETSFHCKLRSTQHYRRYSSGKKIDHHNSGKSQNTSCDFSACHPLISEDQTGQQNGNKVSQSGNDASTDTTITVFPFTVCGSISGMICGTQESETVLAKATIVFMYFSLLSGKDTLYSIFSIPRKT